MSTDSGQNGSHGLRAQPRVTKELSNAPDNATPRQHQQEDLIASGNPPRVGRATIGIVQVWSCMAWRTAFTMVLYRYFSRFFAFRVACMCREKPFRNYHQYSHAYGGEIRRFKAKLTVT